MSELHSAPPAPGELLVVVGPTASGKTELALRLAETYGGEIVGADSVQIYRELDLGSGKPTAEERRRVPHHLVDIADPLDPYDARRFADEADRCCADIRARGRTPIVCGGSFLWVKALLHGLAPAAAADPQLREEHARICAQGGRAALHAELARVDPAASARLAPGDFVRVSRALEIFQLTGRPQSEWHAGHAFAERRYQARLLGARRDRAEIDRRIALRAQRWLEQGWIAEVERLLPRYRHARAMGSVGYRQVRDHLDGKLARDELLPAIVRATRVFVRRQRTWLRDEPVEWMVGP